MASATGPYLTDVDGREYVDLVCSWGPMILGHTHPDVLAAVQAAALKGFSYGTPSENEVALAEEIVARVRPVEQVRLVNSGTEATMSALRLARGLHRPLKGREVRRLLPRARRRFSGLSGQRSGHVRPSGLCRGPGVERRRDDRAALQRCWGSRGSLCPAW